MNGSRDAEMAKKCCFNSDIFSILVRQYTRLGNVLLIFSSSPGRGEPFFMHSQEQRHIQLQDGIIRVVFIPCFRFERAT